ncbi:hypothetical protein N0V83_010481 [Neocucurbitaria cava]|uniref:Uncharacterized protein n=1 Tax=Neocucurbitaria cava TaxID=798079 RepID=A0A9W8XYL0_9PLEO|nr:hypothetical protein N0V83_010481 [Neocucurbitaria cava]
MAPSTAPALVKRVEDLLYPFRDECFDKNAPTSEHEYKLWAATHERKAVALSQNIAYLIQNHSFKVEKTRKHKLAATRSVNADDVSITVSGWDGNVTSPEGGAIAVTVCYPAAMQTVVCAKLQPGDSPIDKLYAKVERELPGTA